MVEVRFVTRVMVDARPQEAAGSFVCQCGTRKILSRGVRGGVAFESAKRRRHSKLNDLKRHERAQFLLNWSALERVAWWSGFDTTSWHGVLFGNTFEFMKVNT